MYYKRELYHHGILGQKWGVRRFQNKDGSLTPAGKVHLQEIKSDVKKTIESNPDKVNSILSQGSKLASMANDLGDSYAKAFSSFEVTSDFKTKMLNDLYDDFGDGVDDDEYFSEIVEEKIMSNLDRVLPESLKSARAKYEKAQEKYWNDVEDFTKDLVSKYENTKIYRNDPLTPYSFAKDGQQAVSRMLHESLDTQWNSYLYRHFDDYWVYDTPEYDSMVNRITKEITADDYNKRFG